jgi:hypothetical protein
LLAGGCRGNVRLRSRFGRGRNRRALFFQAGRQGFDKEIYELFRGGAVWILVGVVLSNI